mgnify:CR=1 FL=1
MASGKMILPPAKDDREKLMDQVCIANLRSKVLQQAESSNANDIRLRNSISRGLDGLIVKTNPDTKSTFDDFMNNKIKASFD